MVFSSVTFLFLFLPLLIPLYFITPRNQRNLLLLAASLLFYLWGSGHQILIIFFSIALDYLLGLVQVATDRQPLRRLCLVVSLIGNLGLLAFFKYTNFFIANINAVFQSFGIGPMPYLDVVLPIGISFYTFQTLSYQIDLYRGDVEGQRSLRDFALFVALFPQLIAGPIVRYKDIAHQLRSRVETLHGFVTGAARFSVGLGKKVLLADGIAPLVDEAFSRAPHTLSPEAVWIALFAFLLQIYFDFSGYSDMAIGLGKMFGFKLPENFRYPYAARSITAFWQRWHITLTTWFRDYLYRPFVGSHTRDPLRVSMGIFIVFTLCGFWHGPNWTFVMFGVYFGVILVLERFFWPSVGRHLPNVVQHVYTWGLLLVSAALFRSPNMGYAVDLLAQGFSFSRDPLAVQLRELVNNEHALLLVVGFIASMPVLPAAQAWLDRLLEREQSLVGAPFVSRALSRAVPALGCVIVLALCFVAVASRVYNPFIYFQF